MIVRKNISSKGIRMKRQALIVALLGVLFGRVDAQRVGNAAATTTSASGIVDVPSPASDTGATTTQAAQQTTTSGNNQQTTATATTVSQSDTTNTQQPSSSSTDLPNISSSAANGLPQLTSSAPLPSLTTNLPQLTQNSANVPTYQIVIPQVNDNPFLQTSSFPEGTVFIVVGSCLAGLALMLIASRAIYIWCLHRQTKQRGKDVKYSEMEQRPYTGVSGNASAAAPFGATAGNNISLDYLRPGDRTSRVSTFSSRPSTGRPSTARPQTSSLRPVSTVANPLSSSSVQFYSPSAHPGGTAAAALGTQSSRDSAYLPAGYYLRDASSNTNNSTASPRQMYNQPTSSAAFLYSDPSAPPITRLSRTPTSNSTSTTGRPGTEGNYGAGYVAGGRPISGYSISGQGQGNAGYTQSRRAPSSNGETYAGDRRSKPTQVLDDLLGGR